MSIPGDTLSGLIWSFEGNLNPIADQHVTTVPRKLALDSHDIGSIGPDEGCVERLGVQGFDDTDFSS